MKTSELLKEIQENIKKYPIAKLEKVADDEIFKKLNNLKEEKQISPQEIIVQMSTFNTQNYYEILSMNPLKIANSSEDKDIENKRIKKLKDNIDFYFEIYAPEDNIFKEFVKNITLYLSLIAKKPLHPVGMKFPNGKGVSYEKRDNGKISYYCSGKAIFINDKNSLCKDCIAKTKN